MKKSLLALALILTTTFTNAYAGSSDASRSKHRLGFYLGIIDPFPSLLAVNLGYNVSSYLRLHGGYGNITATSAGGSLSISTIGLGANVFVTSWAFSPTIGFSWAKVSVTGSATAGTNSYGFSASGSHMYVGGGFDWQAGIGFNFGLGYNFSLQSGVGGAPYLNLGWYF